jgi:hypothetical protein
MWNVPEFFARAILVGDVDAWLPTWRSTCLSWSQTDKLGKV